MLEFFRKYQQYFFIFITIVIVISFSFFGTYNSLPSENSRNEAAFKAVDGTIVTRQELDEMVHFLSTDIDDKLYYGGAWGPNFLNNGAFRKLILQTGIAEILAAQYAAELAPDYAGRLAAENNYVLYTHPQAKFISTETAWTYFAPSLLADYKKMLQADSALAPESFAARVRLYQGEKNFPSGMLQQVLRYQEKQFPWVAPDENLGRLDLSLFGYHSIVDWFGPRFTNLAAEFIINSSIIAKQRGYQVSKEEALADLAASASLSFQQNIRSPHLGVANSQEYFNEQLRRMGMDKNRAAKVWQKVLLARRLFDEAGNSVFVSPDMFSEFVSYANEPVSGEIYQLPGDLKLGDYRSLQKFEVYLDAVAKRSKQDKENLALPETFLSVEEISKTAPELVQTYYTLEIGQIDKNDLLSKISVKDTWKWETQDANWARLQKEFAEIGAKPAATSQERFTVLEGLNDKTRAKVDAYARAQILDARPEILKQALESAPLKTAKVGLPLKGPAGEPFAGIKDASVLSKLLQNALSSNEKVKQAAEQKLLHYSGDQQHYYKIRVAEGRQKPQVLSFKEASRQGHLDKLLDRTLEGHYQKTKETQPQKFQKADGSWKAFADVKDLVADSYFSTTLKAIRAQSESKTALSGDQAAPYRLLPYVKMVKGALEKDPTAAARYVQAKNPSDQPVDASSQGLSAQWALEMRPFQITRSSNSEQINSVEAFDLALGAWSPVKQSSGGAILFYRKLESQPIDLERLTQEKSQQSKKLLAAEAQRRLAAQVVEELKVKKAISLEFLQSGSEMTAAD